MITYNESLEVHTLNLQAEKTCPGKTEFCKTACYAKKGAAFYSITILKLENNLIESFKQSFVFNMIKEIKEKKIKILRIHSSGDFYSKEYFKKWIDIIKSCPECMFFGYTRMWRVKGFNQLIARANQLKNCKLYRSTDPSTSESMPVGNLPIAYILDDKCGQYNNNMPEPNCQKQLNSKHSCLTCQYCYTKNKKYNKITFLRH